MQRVFISWIGNDNWWRFEHVFLIIFLNSEEGLKFHRVHIQKEPKIMKDKITRKAKITKEKEILGDKKEIVVEYESPMAKIPKSIICVHCKDSVADTLVFPCLHCCCCSKCSASYTGTCFERTCVLCKQRIDRIFYVKTGEFVDFNGPEKFKLHMNELEDLKHELKKEKDINKEIESIYLTERERLKSFGATPQLDAEEEADTKEAIADLLETDRDQDEEERDNREDIEDEENEEDEEDLLERQLARQSRLLGRIHKNKKRIERSKCREENRKKRALKIN